MFLYRKNIILVPSDYDGVSLTKGLLSLDCFEGKTECTLRCYNLFTDKPLLLGVSINNALHKIDVKENELKDFKFRIDKTIKNGDEVSCVLINFNKNKYDILLWGSTQLNSGWKSTLQLMLDDELSKNKESENASQNENLNQLKNDSYNADDNFNNLKGYQNSVSYQEELNFEDENIINHCNNHFYSNELDKSEIKSSFTNKSLSEQNANNDAEIYSFEDEKINELIDKVIDMTEYREKNNIKQSADDLNFYERIIPQIEKMFTNNKEETVLNEILPNSKFCKVEFEDGSGYYVFGIIYEEGLPKYLCYGLPAQKNSEPPKELSNLYQWLPIDATDEMGDGYYMMYQDAVTGKNISVEII